MEIDCHPRRSAYELLSQEFLRLLSIRFSLKRVVGKCQRQSYGLALLDSTTDTFCSNSVNQFDRVYAELDGTPKRELMNNVVYPTNLR